MPGESIAETGERPAPRVLTAEELPDAYGFIDDCVTRLGLDGEVDGAGMRTALQRAVAVNCYDDVFTAFYGLTELTDPEEIERKEDELRLQFRSHITSLQRR